MLTVPALWLPILVSAVLVFVASSILHMLLRHHTSDLAKLPDEEAARGPLRSTPPGDYMIPWGSGMEAMKDPAWQEKRREGPVVIMTVMESGDANMGKELTLWFVYSLVVSIFAAYLTSRAVLPGGDFAEVVRFAGTTAFIAYALGDWPQSIWWKRKWSTTLKNTIDGLIYGIVTGLTFGWLWPS